MEIETQENEMNDKKADKTEKPNFFQRNATERYVRDSFGNYTRTSDGARIIRDSNGNESLPKADGDSEVMSKPVGLALAGVLLAGGAEGGAKVASADERR